LLPLPRSAERLNNDTSIKEMPAWGKVMNAQDIADIAEYVYLQFIRGEPAPD